MLSRDKKAKAVEKAFEPAKSEFPFARKDAWFFIETEPVITSAATERVRYTNYLNNETSVQAPPLAPETQIQFKAGFPNAVFYRAQSGELMYMQLPDDSTQDVLDACIVCAQPPERLSQQGAARGPPSTFVTLLVTNAATNWSTLAVVRFRGGKVGDVYFPDDRVAPGTQAQLSEQLTAALAAADPIMGCPVLRDGYEARQVFGLVDVLFQLYCKTSSAQFRELRQHATTSPLFYIGLAHVILMLQVAYVSQLNEVFIHVFTDPKRTFRPGLVDRTISWTMLFPLQSEVPRTTPPRQASSYTGMSWVQARSAWTDFHTNSAGTSNTSIVYALHAMSPALHRGTPPLPVSPPRLPKLAALAEPSISPNKNPARALPKVFADPVSLWPEDPEFNYLNLDHLDNKTPRQPDEWPQQPEEWPAIGQEQSFEDPFADDWYNAAQNPVGRDHAGSDDLGGLIDDELPAHKRHQNAKMEAQLASLKLARMFAKMYLA